MTASCFFSGAGSAAKTLSLTFSPSNRKAAKEVKVYATEDSNNTDETATITISADGLPSETVAVSLLDAGARLIIVPSGSIDVTEGAEPQTFKIKLNSEPAAGRKVRFKKANEKSKYRIKIDGKTDQKVVLTLSKAELKDGKDISVSAVLDNDTKGGTVEITPQLQKIANGGVAWKSATESEISVNVQDDGNIKLSVSKSSLKLAEGGSGTFTVKLASQPSADVTVTLAQPGTANADVTLDDTDANMAGRQNTLTFTTANWSAEQAVKVRAAQDKDGDNDTATIKLTGAGVTPYLMKVSVIDDDIKLILSKSSLTFAEGASGGIAVQLSKQPANDLTVTLTSDNSDVTVDADPDTDGSQSMLRFTRADWDAVKPVTFSAARDNDAVDDTATISLTSADPKIISASAEITVTDDGVGFVLPTAPLTLTEGGSGTFTVALASQPSAEVTVTLRQPTNTDVTVDTDTGTANNQNTLTFTTANWSAAQTVTVSAKEDDDGMQDTAMIGLSAAGGDYDSATGSFGVTVEDSDTPGLTVSATSLTVTEGSTATFTVALATQPSASVTVNITQPNNSNADVTTTPASLTFTTANWRTAQTVTVNGAEDDDGIDDTATLQVKATGGGYGSVDSKSVSVNVDDNDTSALKVSTASLAVPEGLNATFTVKLATQPSASVTVTLAQPIGSVNADVTLDTDTSTVANENTLTFTTENWKNEQTVTVSAKEDDDGIQDRATINLSAAGGDYGTGTVTGSVGVTVTENDTPGLTVSATSLTVPENSSGVFTVELATRPSASVTVSIAQPTDPNAGISPNADVTTNPTSLTFTTGNWNTAQAVTVNAAEDHDGIDDSATLRLSATGGGYDNVEDVDVSVTVDDNDTARLTVSETTLTVEENSSGTFTVRLATQPSASVTVTLAQPTGSVNADVTLDTDPNTANNQNTLTFTTGNWNTAQTVTVRAADDADIADESATINLRASGGDYAGKTGRVTVTVHDDDAKLVLSESSLEIDEDESGTFKVRLKTRPSGSVTVTLKQPDNTDVTVDTNRGADGNQNTLIFTTGNWNADQRVHVSAGEDNDVAEDTAAISLTASGGGYGRAKGSVQVTVNDNDAVLVLSESSLTIEEGQSGNFTVKLKVQPSASVTVTLRQPDNTDVTLDTDTSTVANENTLTFTTDNWNTTQEVTVSTKQDPDAVGDIGKIMLSASGAEYGSATGLVKVMVGDIDKAALKLTPTSLSLNEGQSGNFKVRLATQPSLDVTVTLEQPSGTANPDVTFDTDTSTTGNQNTLSFTSSNWNEDQTVTVKAAQDDDTAQDTATINLSASGGDYGGVTDSVTVTVKDDDKPGLVPPPGSVIVAEGGSVDFAVQLKTQPASNVTVTLNQPSNADVTIVDTDPSTAGKQNTLTFTPSNWNVDKRVTVNAAEDDDAVVDTATINLTASGADYGGVTDQVNVEVTETDTAGLVVEGSPVTVPEGGSSSFTVKLASKPSENVTVTLSQKNDDDSPDVSFDADVSTARIETSFEFTPGNWNTARTINVYAAEDNDAIGDSLTIRLKASDADYSGKTADVPVTVTENDALGLMLSKTVLTMDEGESGTFTVRLASEPSGDVTVELARSGDTDVSVSPASLSFTASSWNRTQTVTVRAAQDDKNSEQDTATINLTASGGGYGSVTGSVAVKVADDDPVDLTLSDTSLTMTEGASTTFTVRLAANPGGERTVSLASTNTDVTVSPVVLSFTSDNATTAKTVTVSAAHDNDKTDDTATIDLTGTGITADQVSVKVLDDDLELVLSTKKLEVTEGTSETFTVRLASRPVNSRTVNLTFSEPNPDVTADTNDTASGNQTTLTFTSGNWNTAEAVTVSAAEDDDEENDSAKLRLSGVGLQTGEVEIEVIDDDGNDEDLRFVLTPSLVTLTEQGRSETFKVRLNLPPGTDRSVNLTSNNPDVRFVGATSLTFTDSNWSEYQTVTIKAIGDSDAADERTTVKVKSTGIPTGQVTVDITDDDSNSLEIIVSEKTNQKIWITIPEGSSGTFTVHLSAPPGSGRTVRVTVENFTNPDVSVSHTSMDFNNTNWDIRKTVTVYAGHDSGWSDDSATVDLVSPGLLKKWVMVTIDDDDSAPPPEETIHPGCQYIGGVCPDPGVEIR